MLEVTKWFNRFAVALGGFLIFIGIAMIGLFIIGNIGLIEFSTIKAGNVESLVLGFLFTIGIIDLLIGIMLWRR